MKVQLIGGPRDGDWIVLREGMREYRVMERPQQLVVAMGPEGAKLPSLDPYIEHLYRLTAHDNCTYTFEYQG